MTLGTNVSRWKAWLLSFCKSIIASYSLAATSFGVDNNLYDTGGFVRGLFVRQVGNLVGVVSWHVGSGVGMSHVGSGVGMWHVGIRDGLRVGFCVPNVGQDVGTTVGIWVGTRVGTCVGAREGLWVGERVGVWVETQVGACVGARVSVCVGAQVGVWVGLRVGENENVGM